MFDQNELNQLRVVVQEVADNRDLQYMREVVTEAVGEALEQVVLPQFEELREEMGGMKQGISWIKANMVTKDFLEDRLADFRTSLTDSADWLGRQFKRLTSIMYQRQILTADEVMHIHAK